MIAAATTMRAATATPVGVDAAMGHFGRITTLGDLPKTAALRALIHQAVALNDAGVKAARATKPKAALEIPADLAAALRRRRGALAHFNAMSPSHQREYIEWLVGAKRAETRSKRLTTAVEWIAEGKSKEWKYRGT